MTVITIDQIPDYLKVQSTLIGLDLGTKTIGIAVSDIGFRLANPRQVIKRKKFSVDCEKLLQVFSSERVCVAVIGLPVNMDGSSGPRAQATRAFVRNMETQTAIPFVFWDERLSTVAAERHLIEMDVSRTKRLQRIDSAAAAFILQGALHRLNNLEKTALNKEPGIEQR